MKTHLGLSLSAGIGRLLSLALFGLAALSAFAQAPTITSYTPTSFTSGMPVTITGTNFTSATAVQFNGVDAAYFTVNSATQIVATVPDTVLTNGSITITTASGTVASGTSFVYSAAPIITGQPANSVTTVGSYVVLQVSALGLPPLSYQWSKNGATIGGVTLASYVLDPAQSSNAGSYTVTVCNSGGSVTSNPATLTVAAYEPYTFTTLAGRAAAGTDDGTGSAARFNAPSSVVRDSLGNLFVADSGSASIRKIVPATGAVTTFVGRVGVAGSADGTGSAAQFSASASPNVSLSLAIDSADNLYVADYGNHTIRKVTPVGVVTTLAGLAGQRGSTDGPGSAARFNFPQGIAVDLAGNVYVGEAWNRTIRKITPAGNVTTLAGPTGVGLSTTGPIGNVDATGSAARFSTPAGVAVDGVGNIYVADQSSKTIRLVTSAGVVTTIAGVSGSTGTADGGALTIARFSSPVALAVNAAASSPGVAATILYVSDGNRLRKVDLGAATVTTLAGVAGTVSDPYVDGTGAAANFNNPRGLTLDTTDTNLYVADFSNNAIRAMAISTTTVTTLAGSPATAGSANGPGSTARFGNPQNMALDGLGNCYVADTMNSVIRKIDAAGNVTTFAGTVGTTGKPAASDGPIASALFNNPAGVATDSANNVYVADTGNNAIRKITVSTGQVSTLAGATDGSSGFTDASGTLARFFSPRGLAVDGVGNVYVADQSNHTIRKIAVGGTVTTLAGLARANGNVDGTGTVARFNNPWDVAVDSAGNVYVADRSNLQLRKITSAGVVTTILFEGNMALGVGIDSADNVYTSGATGVIFKVRPSGAVTAIAGLAGNTGSADGTGATVRFSGMASGLKVDSAGNVYVADANNNTIRFGWLAIAPAITTQPQDRTVNAGDTATFSMTVTGTEPLSYRWQKGGINLVDGGNLSGAGSATLTLANVSSAAAGNYTVVVSNAAGSVTSAAARLTVLSCEITSISPAMVLAGSGSFTLTVTGSGFVVGATVLWNGAARPTTFVSTTQLTAAIPAGDIPTVIDLQTVSITVRPPTGGDSNAQPLTVKSSAVTGVQAGIASEGAAVTVSVPPAAPNGGGVTATLTNATLGSGPATIAVATYGSQPALDPGNPNPRYFFRIEAGYYDVQIAGVDASDRVAANFYWPSAIVSATESAPDFILYYFDGITFSPVKSSGGADPAKNTADNLDGTDSGGRFTVVFDNTSSPQLSALTGTIFAIGIKDNRVPATLTLAGLNQVYDGTPRVVTVTTNPVSLPVAITYNGSASAPVLPGTYAVVATITDANYTGSVTDTLTVTTTALLRHAPTLNGGLDGSVQVVSAEAITLNGNAWISGDLLVPGTPATRLNGHPTFGGIRDGDGSATPANYTVTLNGNALLRYLVRRTDPIALPVVSAPPAPTGTRDVAINKSSQTVGDFATVRNLTLNGNVGFVAVPPGTYGNLTANGNSGFIFGVAGATAPVVYNLQGLTLNGNTQLRIVGPVLLLLKAGPAINGSIGAETNPDWLTLKVYSGGVTLNGNVALHGFVVAPNGTVTINGNSTLNGGVVADRLIINGNGLLNAVDP